VRNSNKLVDVCVCVRVCLCVRVCVCVGFILLDARVVAIFVVSTNRVSRVMFPCWPGNYREGNGLCYRCRELVLSPSPSPSLPLPLSPSLSVSPSQCFYDIV